MPKETFFKLKEEKRKALTDAFLREFALHTFDEASITSVVKQLGIAKGSVYQYFEGKLDLFLYLSSECAAVKGKYVEHLKREDFENFWSYFRALYQEGVKFDLENPLQSHFLHNLSNNLNSPSIQSLYSKYLDQAVSAFEAMVAQEVKNGYFRDDLPVKTMSFFLYKSSLAINEQMTALSGLDPQESIQLNVPVYQGKVDLLMQTVEQYIALLQKGLDK